MDNSTKPATFVAQLDLSLGGKLLAGLKEQGFEITNPPFTIFSGKKKGVSCTLYSSGKLLVQGKEKDSFIEFYLEPEILQSFSYNYDTEELDTKPRIGIDESGKGDFFGPLCVAGVFAQGDEIRKLKELGVKDSKKITDSNAISLSNKIRNSFKHHIVRINPLKYNELYTKFCNLNRLLAWGHATVIEELAGLTSCHTAIIDQFADEHVVITALKRKKLSIDLTQRHRAEEDLVVAAASILARAAFLEGLDKLSEEWGIKLPKGASAAVIKAAQSFADRHGKDALKNVAKLHFKTLEKV